MANTDNLTYYGKDKHLTHEQATEYGRKGGQKTQANLRKFKTLRETLQVLLQMPSEENPNMTNAEAVMVAMLKKAKDGQVAAVDLFGKLLGEYINKTEILTNKTAQEYAQEFLKSLKDE